MCLLGINEWLIEKRSFKSYTQQYLKMDPSNIFEVPEISPFLRLFHYYPMLLLLLHSVLKRVDAFLGLCRQLQVLINNIKDSTSYYDSVPIVCLGLCAS